jgi:hypothetical protein
VANCVSLICGVVTLSVVSSSTSVFVDELKTFGSELWFKHAGFIIASLFKKRKFIQGLDQL